MKKITFEIETITPMFLSGANQSKAELRAASIKGLLRFWWRALQAESDLNELRKKEAKIFGSSEEGVGGSSFSIRVTYNDELRCSTDDLPKHNITVTSKSRGQSFPVNILEYLAYGPCTYNKDKKRNVIVREYIEPGFNFTIRINIVTEAFMEEILQTMLVFDLFGGIGSKSRNGYGSFCIKNREACFKLISNKFAIQEQYTKQNLQKIVKQIESNSYSSFAKGTKIFRTEKSYNTWDKALGEMGKIYRGVRSGDIKKDNVPFEKHFKYDKRQYIASPIIVDKQEKSFLDRHAKPYFIKIAKESDKYRAYILYLPSRYCDGLEKDRNGLTINHSNEDKKFAEVCNEFNSFLAANMETVI